MTIDKAIEILTLTSISSATKLDHDYVDALKLGIEALKDYSKLKRTTFLPIGYKLPSETKD